MANAETEPDHVSRNAALTGATVGDGMLHLIAILLFSFPVFGYFLAKVFQQQAGVGILFGLAVASVGLFFLAFTGNPTRARMGWMVRYCYLFCFMAVVTAIMPFFLLEAGAEVKPANASGEMTYSMSQMVSGTQSSPESLKGYINWLLTGDKAIGVVVGCRDKQVSKVEIPQLLDCDKSGFQWVVHIGGILNPASGNGGRDIDEKRGVIAHAAARDEQSPRLQFANFQVPVSQSDAYRSGRMSSSGETFSLNGTHNGVKRYHVEGGIVFPLSLVVISLIGGAVSMTRRVPVIQCHLWEEMSEHSMASRYRIRQDLILQMMQFVSAPFVALIAIAMLEPPTMAVAVGVAFLSGFASEYVLLTIGSVFDKLKPETQQKP